MKKTILTAALILACTFLKAQSFINYPLDEFKSKVEGELTVTKDTEFTAYSTFDKDCMKVWYFANRTNPTCYLHAYSPNSNIGVSARVETLNREAAIISPTRWNYYVNGVVLDIELEWNKDMEKFIFYYSEKSN